jgi:hypothetical protein
MAQHRSPKTRTAAQAGALALIEFLKKTDEPIRPPVDRISVGAWPEKFTRVEGNPKAALNEAKNRPYSLNTINRYEGLYRTYIKSDPFAALPMAELDEADALEFVSRMARRKMVGNNQAPPEKNSAELKHLKSW